MKLVFSASFLEEVLVVRSILASTGIESALVDEGSLEVYPFFENFGEGIRLGVADGDEEDARALVADYLERRKEARE